MQGDPHSSIPQLQQQTTLKSQLVPVTKEDGDAHIQKWNCKIWCPWYTVISIVYIPLCRCQILARAWMSWDLIIRPGLGDSGTHKKTSKKPFKFLSEHFADICFWYKKTRGFSAAKFDYSEGKIWKKTCFLICETHWTDECQSVSGPSIGLPSLSWLGLAVAVQLQWVDSAQEFVVRT